MKSPNELNNKCKMGLLSILKKMKQKEKDCRILMLYPFLVTPPVVSLRLFYLDTVYVLSSGLDNAGKTTIVKKFLGEDITTISPTFGFNIKTVEHKGWGLFTVYIS